MTSYRITTPRKQGSVTVVDVIEYKGGFGITRRTTLRLEQVQSFINGVFSEKVKKRE